MEVQVAAPAPAPEFNFDSGCSSPFMTAPSSPQHIAPFFFSAPASPSRRHTPEPQDDTLSQQDFQFDFSGHLDTPYLSAADELFDCGRIRPLKPLCSSASSPKRVKSTKSKDRKSEFIAPLIQETRPKTERGSRTTSSSSRYDRHGSCRSLSTLRISDITFEQEDAQNHQNSSQVSVTDGNLKSYPWTIFSFSKTYKKWKLKDFLLFRSASEGRPTDKETLKKYGVLSKATEAGSSFRSTGSISRRRLGAVSAHELHYTSKRAAAEEMRKKTYLPYRQGLLGCIGLPGDMPA